MKVEKKRKSKKKTKTKNHETLRYILNFTGENETLLYLYIFCSLTDRLTEKLFLE